jgi:hypothetical protein
MARKLCIILLAALTTLGLSAAAQGTANATGAPAASAGVTLTVDNDRKDCPNADYTRIRDAIDAAHDGDTIFVCAGTYAEGPGTVGSTALPITKSLTIRGVGADKVTIEPKSTKENRIAESDPDIRNGKGVIIVAKGDPNAPITFHISGVTVDANGVDATAGVVFLDAEGSVDRSLVTGVDVDESADGYTVAGGFRNNAFGIGIAAVTRVRPPAAGKQPPIAPRTITIDHTRVERYNAVGVLVDAATSDYSPSGTTPVQASGVPIRAILTSDQISGRNSCQNYNDPTAGGPTVIDGDCQASGGSNPIPPPLPLTTGPLFGQDGVRVTAGASVQMSDDTISSNLVHGEGAPVASVFAPTPNNDPYPLGNHAEHNANLRLGAGLRLVGAAASSITDSNIADNAFGVLNTTADGVANNTATPVQAQRDW